MYLVGDLSYREYFELDVKFKHQITKEDLGKCASDRHYQVINIIDKTYFEPDDNIWKPLKSE